jgi:hypothetical protein
MTSRFLSLVAVAGLLAAAGCSGGGAGSALGALTGGGGVSPSTGAGGSSAVPQTTAGNSSFTTTFNIPVAGNLNTQTQGRSPLYVSPGSTGLQVILSANGTAASGAGQPGSGQLSGTVTLCNTVTGLNTPAGTAAGASANGTTCAAATQPNYNAANSITVSLVPGSVSTTPVPNQTFTLQLLPSSTYYQTVTGAGGTPATQGSQSLTFVIDTVTANNTVITAHSQANAAYAGNPEAYIAGSIITFGGASSATFAIGSATQPAQIIPGTSGTVAIPTSVYGTTATSSYTYKFAQPNNASGYVQGTITFNNMAPSTNFVVGIVLTDTTNPNNYILSEGQSLPFTTTAAGASNVNLTLNPVVANVYIPAPTVLTAANAGVFAANSFETTVFATDERGWVIPSITFNGGNTLPAAPGLSYTDNAATITITPAVAGSLTFGVGTAPGQLAVSSITQAPTAGAATNMLNAVNIGLPNGAFAPVNANYANPLGGFITNPSVPAAPFTLPLNTPLVAGVATPTATNTNGVGNPLNIACAVSTANVALKVVLNSTTPAAGAAIGGPAQLPVAGVTYNPGVNYPASGNTTIPAGSNIATVNCTPSFNVNVN